nr:DUF317 domain-containing protein [Streptomyces tailanensis]
MSRASGNRRSEPCLWAASFGSGVPHDLVAAFAGGRSPPCPAEVRRVRSRVRRRGCAGALRQADRPAW